MKALIIDLECELHEGCIATASGHPDFNDKSAVGTTPDEAKGRLITQLYTEGSLDEPFNLFFRNSPKTKKPSAFSQLSEDEKSLLARNGWIFRDENYMYIPGNEEESWQEGIEAIRKVVNNI